MELVQILQIIKKRLILIIMVTLIFTTISAIISYFYLTPQYKATTTLIVGKNNENAKMQYNDILMYQKLVKTYVQVAKSRKVSEETIKKLSLGITPEELLGGLTVSSAADTEVLYISYVSKNREEAAKVADGLAQVFIERSRELFKTQNIQIIDFAKVPNGPFKPRKALNILIAFFLGLMVSLGLSFVLEYQNSTIKTIDEVEELLDIPVVGIVPYTK